MKITEEILTQDYCVNKLTTREIAKKYGIGATTVKRLLKKFNIPINYSKRNTKSSILTKEFLYEHYIQLGKTCRQIAEETGLSSHTVSVNLNRNNINKRLGTRKGCKNKNIYKPKVDLLKKEFGDLKVVEYVKGGWLCKCKCGQTKVYGTKRLIGDKVQSCGCRKKNKGPSHHLWKGCGDISKSFYLSYYEGAKDRNIDFDVSIEYLWSLLQEQNFKCSISQQKLIISPKRERTASLDRIDSTKGYVEGNLQWLHKIVNQMKWNHPQKEFINWCKIITEANQN